MHERRITLGLGSAVCIGLSVFMGVSFLRDGKVLHYAFEGSIVTILLVTDLLLFLIGVWLGYIFFSKPDEQYHSEDKKQAEWNNRHPRLRRLILYMVIVVISVSVIHSIYRFIQWILP
ncbi:MAG: hypothetical protein LBV12_12490 [Puniceicoccales bacterium]|nr:hypothetical protein [Puniceicoccales bacterium]